MIIWLAIAVQLSAPLPAKRTWLSAYDVPIGLLRENVLQTVGIAITVRPDGKIQDCLVEVSSGNPKLDAYTCKLARRRGKFRAGREVNGSPVYGVYRGSINWWVGDGYPPSRLQHPDLYLTVSDLPPKIKSPVAVRLMLAVDDTGRPSNCVAEDEEQPAALVRVGCEQLIKSYTAKPARTSDGAAVASTQTAIVAFEVR